MPAPAPDPLEQARLRLLESVRLVAEAQERTRADGYSQAALAYEDALWTLARARLHDYTTRLDASDRP